MDTINEIDKNGLSSQPEVIYRSYLDLIAEAAEPLASYMILDEATEYKLLFCRLWDNKQVKVNLNKDLKSLLEGKTAEQQEYFLNNRQEIIELLSGKKYQENAETLKKLFKGPRFEDTN